MSALADRLQSRIADLQSQMIIVQQQAQATLIRLNDQLMQLSAITKLVTPEAEAALQTLQNLGLLEIK
jgi:hypothetical protein